MMAQIVMSHNYSNYECPGTEVLCFEYDSPEAFLVGFEDAWRAANQRLKDSKIAVEKWLSNRPKSRSKSRKHEEEMQKWFASRPKDADHYFLFCGYRFQIEEFQNNGEAGQKDPFDVPDVYELQEWFKARCINIGRD